MSGITIVYNEGPRDSSGDERIKLRMPGIIIPNGDIAIANLRLDLYYNDHVHCNFKSGL